MYVFVCVLEYVIFVYVCVCACLRVGVKRYVWVRVCVNFHLFVCVCVYSLYNDGADYDNVYTWELCVRKRS